MSRGGTRGATSRSLMVGFGEFAGVLICSASSSISSSRCGESNIALISF